jgi:leucyl aminopeptidase
LKPPIKNLIPIKFDDVAVSSKVFYGKKIAIIWSKKMAIPSFYRFGKSIDYKSLKRYSAG